MGECGEVKKKVMETEGGGGGGGKGKGRRRKTENGSSLMSPTLPTDEKIQALVAIASFVVL